MASGPYLNQREFYFAQAPALRRGFSMDYIESAGSPLTVNIPDIASIVIACLALALAVWEGRQARRHNKLSVRPHVVADQCWTRDNNGLTITYVFRNIGIGPAIFDELVITQDRKRIAHGDENPLRVALINALSGKLDYKIKQITYPTSDYGLEPQREYVLCELSFPGLSKDEEQILTQLVDGTDLELHYHSLYMERFVYPKNKTASLNDL